MKLLKKNLLKKGTCDVFGTCAFFGLPNTGTGEVFGTIVLPTIFFVVELARQAELAELGTYLEYNNLEG